MRALSELVPRKKASTPLSDSCVFDNPMARAGFMLPPTVDIAGQGNDEETKESREESMDTSSEAAYSPRSPENFSSSAEMQESLQLRELLMQVRIEGDSNWTYIVNRGNQSEKEPTKAK